MAVSLNQLLGGSNYGLSTPTPTQKQLSAQFYNSNVGGNLLQPYSSPAVSAAKNTTSSKPTGVSSGSNPSSGNSGGGSPPPYSPDTVNQTVDYNGVTWKGNPGQGWTAQGTTGGGGSDPAKAMMDEINSEFTKQNTQYKSALSAYDAENPFSFDEMLKEATAKATTNISPTYTEALNNYLQGVEYTKGNTLQDKQRALTLLQADYDAFTGKNKAVLDTTLNQVGQDYAGQGGYDSGARARAQGIQKANEQYDQEAAQRQYAYNTQSQQIQADRMLNQTLPLQVTNTEQQAANQERSDIYNQSQELATQAQQAQMYNSQKNAINAITSQGQYSSDKTMPGMSSPQTTQFLQSFLPNVKVDSYSGETPTPLIAYQ